LRKKLVAVNIFRNSVNLTSNGSQLYQVGKSTFSGDMTDTRNVVTKVTDHRSQLSKL